MSRVRFATARALFETFPELGKKIGAGPNDQFPIDYLKALSSQDKMEDAVTFCAYLLPRREAVWWACGCVRDLLGAIPQARAAGLLAAEAWVYEPDDERRQAALEIGTNGDSNDPITWLALGAGWAGGFLVFNAKRQVAMPQYMTPRGARIAVLISALKVKRDERAALLKPCIAEGVKLAENGLS
jgi:hypothetical protein